MQRDGEAEALEQRSCGDHHVVPGRVVQGLWMADVLHAFEKRHATTEAEDQHRNDEAPEIQFIAMTKRGFRGARPLAEPYAYEQEHAVESVD